MRRPQWGVVLLVCIVAALNGAVTDGQSNAVVTFLGFLSLTPDDVASVEQGRPVAKLLPVHDDREIALLGAIRIGITPDEFASKLLDIAHFKRDPAILQIGVFGRPPSIDDVQRLTLDDSDLRALRSCHIGNCDVRLSASLIGSARGNASNEWFRTTLVDYVRQYEATGNAALMTYADASEPVRLRDQFRSLSAAPVLGHFPLLRSYLLHAPADSLTTDRNVIYWSKEQIGPAHVVTVTDLVIRRVANGSPARYVAASKQIYASRLFDTSLSVTVLLPDQLTTDATDLIYVNRSRVDVFHGPFGGIIRTIAKRRVRSAISNYLERTRQRLEHPDDVPE